MASPVARSPAGPARTERLPGRATWARRVGAVVALAPALALAACAPSKIAPGADVTVSGTLLRQTAAVASGRSVYLTRDLGPSDLLPGVLTAGLACLSDTKPEVCRSGVRQATTDSSGRFGFHLKGSDTQTVFGNTRHFDLAAELPAPPRHVDGAGVTAGLVIQTEKLDLPDLRWWEAATHLDSSGGQGSVAFDSLPATGFGKLRQYNVVFTDAAGDAVWSLSSGTSPVPFDLRLLEDSSGVAAVHARATEAAPATPLDLDYRAPTTAYASAAGAPASRGAPCTIGPPGALKTSPCPLTDADFATPLSEAVNHPRTSPSTAPLPAPQAVPTSAVVDTAAVRGMTFVVVRGCSTACAVDVSANGIGWAGIGSVVGDGALTPSGGTAVARYVRVTVASGDLSSLREVSVWDQSPAPAAGTGLVRPGGHLAPRRGSGGAKRARWWLVAIALVLLLGAAGAIVRLLTFRPLWKASPAD